MEHFRGKVRIVWQNLEREVSLMKLYRLGVESTLYHLPHNPPIQAHKCAERVYLIKIYFHFHFSLFFSRLAKNNNCIGTWWREQFSKNQIVVFVDQCKCDNCLQTNFCGEKNWFVILKMGCGPSKNDLVRNWKHPLDYNLQFLLTTSYLSVLVVDFCSCSLILFLFLSSFDCQLVSCRFFLSNFV